MIRVEDALRKGFARAHRSFGLIFLDIFGKAVWLAVTMAAIALVAGWFASQLRSIEWQAPNLPGGNALMLAGLMREIWNTYAARLFWLFVLAGAFSLVVWILLEAYVRSRLVGKLGDAARTFPIFLLSGVATRLVMIGAIMTIGSIIFSRYFSSPVAEWPALWSETQGPVFAGLVAVCALGFVLKIFETAVRSDAVELFGRNLLEFAGIVGTLMLFEGLVDAAFVVVVFVATLMAASSTDVIAAGALAAISIVIVSILNSYLLLVRYSAIDIMRHDAVDI
jgi:hypothetical protein